MFRGQKGKNIISRIKFKLIGWFNFDDSNVFINPAILIRKRKPIDIDQECFYDSVVEKLNEK